LVEDAPVSKIALPRLPEAGAAAVVHEGVISDNGSTPFRRDSHAIVGFFAVPVAVDFVEGTESFESRPRDEQAEADRGHHVGVVPPRVSRNDFSHREYVQPRSHLDSEIHRGVRRRVHEGNTGIGACAPDQGIEPAWRDDGVTVQQAGKWRSGGQEATICGADKADVSLISQHFDSRIRGSHCSQVLSHLLIAGVIDDDDAKRRRGVGADAREAVVQRVQSVVSRDDNIASVVLITGRVAMTRDHHFPGPIVIR
jgi:hypothetical protein